MADYISTSDNLRRRTIHREPVLKPEPEPEKPKVPRVRFRPRMPKIPKKIDNVTIGRLMRTRGPPPIPKCAALGFHEYPFLIKVSSIGMFCSMIAVSLPYWVWIWVEESQFYAVFGLWNYCQQEHFQCTSIHDNIMPGRDVPVWFILVQWSFLIGVVMTLVAFSTLVHNYNGKTIKMSPTVYMAAECISAIAAVQKFLSLYTFLTYFNELDFLHLVGAELDYHSAFYCAVITFCCDVIIAVVLFLDEDIGPQLTNRDGSNPNPLMKLSDDYDKMKVYRQGADTYLYNSKTSQMEYHLHES